ncbi:probable NADH dehydrogenase [ubiquinone] 1 alpha subcomplex subunit 12 [Panonychus citri]|uniref:probable NADH dehydrogenase [ubiquinone] 1 alpha subcomplex subunit 12 n=1 Tax=Panonychus citri TaxID=50023 RepID=UPI0023079AF5|nr:probable NADH dehydrogenase [ubiquinone] 1 alpha subcomplex subunit 12 [Panonychus citri]
MQTSKLSKWLCIDKLMNFREILKTNGGLFGAAWNLHRHSMIKWGTLVGEDKYGNKYYENKHYFYLSDRWVVYNEKCNLEYDASMIPPEWHNWMHHVTDKSPTEEPRVQYAWLQDHQQNLTGSAQAYTPYSTVKDKIGSWNPPGGRVVIGPNK